MQRAAISALRWLGALVAFALVIYFALPRALEEFRAGIAFGGGEEPTEAVPTEAATTPPPEPTEPVEDGTAFVLADFGVSGGAVVDAGAEVTELSSSDQLAVLAFPRIEGDLACIEHVRLDVQLQAPGPVEIGAMPATIFDATDIGDGAGVEEPLGLTDEPRAVAGTDGVLNFLPWNLTEAYAEYVGAEQVPEDAPFVVALRTVTGDAGTVQVTLSEAGEDTAPRLTWLGIEGCGVTDDDAEPEATEPAD